MRSLGGDVDSFFGDVEFFVVSFVGDVEFFGVTADKSFVTAFSKASVDILGDFFTGLED